MPRVIITMDIPIDKKQAVRIAITKQPNLGDNPMQTSLKEAITDPSKRVMHRLKSLTSTGIPIQSHHPTMILQRLQLVAETIQHKQAYKDELDATITALQSQSLSIGDTINKLNLEHHTIDRALWYQQLRDLNHPFIERPQSPCGPERLRQIAKPKIKRDAKDQAGFNAIADKLPQAVLDRLKQMGYKQVS